MIGRSAARRPRLHDGLAETSDRAFLCYDDMFLRMLKQVLAVLALSCQSQINKTPVFNIQQDESFIH